MEIYNLVLIRLFNQIILLFKKRKDHFQITQKLLLISKIISLILELLKCLLPGNHLKLNLILLINKTNKFQIYHLINILIYKMIIYRKMIYYKVKKLVRILIEENS